jgi:hypothetical protein
MEDAIADAIASFNGTLADAAAQFNQVTDDATAAHEADLQARLDWWNEQKAHELKHAKWTKDSYYRYQLMRLIAAKDSDVLAALQAARDAWADWVAAEQAESADFRAGERDSLAAFTAGVRQDLQDAIAEDKAYGKGVWEELDEALDDFLDSERARLQAAMDAAREWFRKALKKIYGFEYGLIGGYSHVGDAHGLHAYNIYAPYTHHQHQQFLYKFHHYHEGFLA